MKKYLIAASALALGLVATGAMADSQANGNGGNVLSAVGNSSNDGADNNDVDLGSGNSDDDQDNDYNGNNRDNDGNGNNRGNTDVEVGVEIGIDIDNSINGSVVAEQDLTAVTIDTDVVFDDATLQLLDGSNDFNTGGIVQQDDAFRGFTGIATIAMDTSVGSNNQAATQVAAGADIIFE